MLFDERRTTFVLSDAPRQKILLGLTVLILGLAGTARPEEATKYELRATTTPDQFQRVRVLLEVSGQLKINGEDKKVTQVPLQVNGELLYDERVLKSDTQNKCRSSVRYYDTAAAELRIGETSQKTSLHPDRRLAATQVTATETVLFSPLAPFTRDELELLETQANSAALYRLLPDKAISLGQSWNHDNSAVAALLCLDAITQTDVKSTLRQVEKSLAIVDLEGSVNGSVRGVSSDIQVRGKYNFDLKQGTFTWITLSISEKRASSAAEPGFEVVAKLREVLAPTPPRAELSDATIKDLTLDPGPGSTLLSLASSAGRFQLLHTRQWRVMMDRTDLTVLRMLDQGDLIAQCNASRLPDLPAGQRVSVESFQADVKRALGEHFGEFRDVTQESTDGGLRVLRAVVSGTASELPIQWSYYHLSDDKGHQAAIVFTMDARLVEKFAEADRTIISSFAFTGSAEAAPETATETAPVAAPAAAPDAAAPAAPKSGDAKPEAATAARPSSGAVRQPRR